MSKPQTESTQSATELDAAKTLSTCTLQEVDQTSTWQQTVGKELIEGFKRMDTDPAFLEEVRKKTR